MSTQVSTQQPTRIQETRRGRGGNRGRGGRRGANARRTATGGIGDVGSNAVEDKQKDQGAQVGEKEEQGLAKAPATAPVAGEDAGEEDDVCWICAEPVKYWSVSDCNHRTCHVCALRLRALYKKTDCTFCKVCFFILNWKSDLICPLSSSSYARL